MLRDGGIFLFFLLSFLLFKSGERKQRCERASDAPTFYDMMQSVFPCVSLFVVFLCLELESVINEWCENYHCNYCNSYIIYKVESEMVVTSMGPELQSQNRIDVCYGKTVGLGAWLTIALWKSNISLWLSKKEKSLAPKLTEWQPFKYQILNGRGGLPFWATPFKFWKSTNFLKSC